MTVLPLILSSDVYHVRSLGEGIVNVQMNGLPTFNLSLAGAEELAQRLTFAAEMGRQGKKHDGQR